MIDVLIKMEQEGKIGLSTAYKAQIDSSRILKSPCFSNGLKEDKIKKILNNFNSSKSKFNQFACLKVQNYNTNVKELSDISYHYKNYDSRYRNNY